MEDCLKCQISPSLNIVKTKIQLFQSSYAVHCNGDQVITYMPHKDELRVLL